MKVERRTMSVNEVATVAPECQRISKMRVFSKPKADNGVLSLLQALKC